MDGQSTEAAGGLARIVRRFHHEALLFKHAPDGNSSVSIMRIHRHLGAVLLLLGSAVVVIGLWITVQASRSDPLPTLVWARDVPDTTVMTASPLVLDRLGNGWWWVYATPADRLRLKQAGVALAVALPTPLAQMAGCSMPVPVTSKGLFLGL